MSATNHKYSQRPQLERLPSVISRTGRSKSSILRDVAIGTFPKPVRIGVRAIAWDTAAVDAWIGQRIADSHEGVAPA